MMLAFGRRALRLFPWNKKNEQKDDDDSPLLRDTNDNKSHKSLKKRTCFSHPITLSSDSSSSCHEDEVSYRWSSTNPSPPLLCHSSSGSSSDRSSYHDYYRQLLHNNPKSCSIDDTIPSSNPKKSQDKISLLTDCDDNDRHTFDLEDVVTCGLDDSYIKHGLPNPEIPIWVLQPDFVWLMPPAADTCSKHSMAKLERIIHRRKANTNHVGNNRKNKRKKMVTVVGSPLPTSNRSRGNQLTDQVQSMPSQNRSNSIVSRLGSLFVSSLPTVTETLTAEEEEGCQGHHGFYVVPKKPRLQYSYLEGIAAALPVSAVDDGKAQDDDASHFSVNSSYSDDVDVSHQSDISYVEQGLLSESDNSTITTTSTYFKEENYRGSADDTSTTISSLSSSIATNNDFVWKEEIRKDLVDSSDHEIEAEVI